ncbi:MAG: DUF1273 family protein [Alphaproteobacteria bacterium]|nr:DUF1273 family protein [Alphaproteobacteria bacterium]
MGKVCAFFGRRDVWICEKEKELKERLEKVVETLITHENVDTFFVGGHGLFDYWAGEVTRRLKTKYPNIETILVMAYGSQLHQKKLVPFDTFLLPANVERCKKLFAIPARNEYMVKHSDYVVAYVDFLGGAYNAVKLALKKKKTVINLGSWDLVEEFE